MASLDTRRPAAMEQLAVLGEQNGIATLPIVAGQQPVQIAKRALEAARLGGYDVVLLDTAGRTTVDEALMAEVAEVKKQVSPHEVLLVADALTGQDAVNTARAFEEPGRHHRHRADPRRRRWPRRRRALDAPRHRQADQAARHRREGRRAGGLRPRPRRRPHPRHGRHRGAGREGGRGDRRREGGQDGRPHAQGRLRPRRPARPAHPDGEARRRRRRARHAARHRQDEGPDRRLRHERRHLPPPARHHRFDDARRSAATPTSSRPAASGASPPAPAPRSRRSTSC